MFNLQLYVGQTCFYNCNIPPRVWASNITQNVNTINSTIAILMSGNKTFFFLSRSSYRCLFYVQWCLEPVERFNKRKSRLLLKEGRLSLLQSTLVLKSPLKARLGVRLLDQRLRGDEVRLKDVRLCLAFFSYFLLLGAKRWAMLV